MSKFTQQIHALEFGCWMYDERHCPKSAARRRFLAMQAKRAYACCPQHPNGELDYESDVDAAVYASDLFTLVESARLWQSRAARNQLRRKLRWANSKNVPHEFIEEK